MSRTRSLAAVAVLLSAGVVQADTEREDPYSYAWSEKGLQWKIGVMLTMGLGTGAFSDRSTNDMAGSAVVWSSRALFGSHIPLGLEAGFAASTWGFDTPEGTRGTVDGQTTDLALHWNVLPHSLITPYLFGGIGWQRYKASEAVGVLGLSRSTEMPGYPLGGGVSYRTERGFVADARATYRSIVTPESLDRLGFALSSWEATASIGVEL